MFYEPSKNKFPTDIYMQVEELWDSMCSTAISLTSRALAHVDNAEVLVQIKGAVALFIQTMEVNITYLHNCDVLT